MSASLPPAANTRPPPQPGVANEDLDATKEAVKEALSVPNVPEACDIKRSTEESPQVAGAVDQLKDLLLAAHPDTRFQRESFLRDQMPDDVAALFVRYATLETGNCARLVRMEMSNCHENAEKLAARHGWSLWTGLALSDDGCWRVHSWCRNTRERIVETTMVRTHYFGLQVRGPAAKGARRGA